MGDCEGVSAEGQGPNPGHPGPAGTQIGTRGSCTGQPRDGGGQGREAGQSLWTRLRGRDPGQAGASPSRPLRGAEGALTGWAPERFASGQVWPRRRPVGPAPFSVARQPLGRGDKASGRWAAGASGAGAMDPVIMQELARAESQQGGWGAGTRPLPAPGETPGPAGHRPPTGRLSPPC